MKSTTNRGDGSLTPEKIINKLVMGQALSWKTTNPVMSYFDIKTGLGYFQERAVTFHGQ